MYALISPLPYNPQDRLISRRVEKTKGATSKEWRSRLGYLTIECTKTTLENTTQIVQTLQIESMEYLRVYYKTTVWSLILHRINDMCYSDTIFSSFTSTRWYKSFQLTKVKWVKREVQAPEQYKDIIR